MSNITNTAFALLALTLTACGTTQDIAQGAVGDADDLHTSPAHSDTLLSYCDGYDVSADDAHVSFYQIIGTAIKSPGAGQQWIVESYAFAIGEFHPHGCRLLAAFATLNQARMAYPNAQLPNDCIGVACGTQPINPADAPPTLPAGVTYPSR